MADRKKVIAENKYINKEVLYHHSKVIKFKLNKIYCDEVYKDCLEYMIADIKVICSKREFLINCMFVQIYPNYIFEQIKNLNIGGEIRILLIESLYDIYVEKIDENLLKVKLLSNNDEDNSKDYEIIKVYNFMLLFKVLYDSIDKLLVQGYSFSKKAILNDYLMEKEQYDHLLKEL